MNAASGESSIDSDDDDDDYDDHDYNDDYDDYDDDEDDYISVISVTLNKKSANVIKGKSITLKATVKPSNAAEKNQ